MKVIKCDFCGTISEFNQVNSDYRYYEVCSICKNNFEKAENEILKLRINLKTKLDKESIKIKSKYGVLKTIEEEENKK